MTNHTRYAVDLMVEDSSYYFSNFLLSWISVLDSLGAWEWNLRFFSIAWFLFFAAIRLIFGKKLGVEWYAVIHALITGVGGVVCAYLYHVMAEKLIGTPGKKMGKGLLLKGVVHYIVLSHRHFFLYLLLF